MGIWLFITAFMIALGCWTMYENHRQTKENKDK